MTRRFGPSLAASRSLRASGDRWLFGYADIVTLLFACFAALYAAQNTPTQAATAPAPAPVLTPASGKTASMPDLEAALASIVAASDQVRLELATAESGLVVSLEEAGSFPAGRADLSIAAQRVIAQLADTFRDRPVALRIEGHSDDQPIQKSKYESNWELSTARAARVVTFLVTRCGIQPERLSAAGYGEFRPKVPNDSLASRARNRRVDLVVLPVQDQPAGADYRGADERRSAGR